MRNLALLIVIIIELMVSACSSTARAPVDIRDKTPPAKQTASVSQASTPTSRQAATGDYHVVVKGDTLYSIAWRYGLDYKDVASWNDISGKYVIYPGQFIRLKPSKKTTTALTPGPIVSKKKSTDATTKKPVAGSQPEKPKGNKSQGKQWIPAQIAWRWPTRGKLVKLNTPTSKKGVDIQGKVGQKITAAADGDVVYSGSGLLGYGKLIIIKHNENYLSAYAHNEKLFAREGDRVKGGQQIATMGLAGSNRPLLHFEIRKDGSPVDPLKHLPRKQS